MLTARWRRGKAEFATEPARYDYGKDDLTPRDLNDIGFDDPALLKVDLAVDYLWSCIYQKVPSEKVAPHRPLSPAKKEGLGKWLNIQLEQYQRRFCLVLDRFELGGAFDLNAALREIHRALPQIHLIVIDSGATNDPRVFVLPATQLAAEIYDCLIAIEALE